jgi:hypothetical protein
MRSVRKGRGACLRRPWCSHLPGVFCAPAAPFGGGVLFILEMRDSQQNHTKPKRSFLHLSFCRVESQRKERFLYRATRHNRARRAPIYMHPLHASLLKRLAAEIPPREEQQQREGLQNTVPPRGQLRQTTTTLWHLPQRAVTREKQREEEESPVGDPPVAGNTPPHT